MRTGRETAVFVRRRDAFLMLHRSLDRYWHVVAGVVEDGETFGDAAARELREEVGLEVTLTDLDIPQRYAVPDDKRSEYPPSVEQVAIANFSAEAPAGWEPTLNEEHDAYRWLDLADAMAIARWPETIEVIVALARPRPEVR